MKTMYKIYRPVKGFVKTTSSKYKKYFRSGHGYNMTEKGWSNLVRANQAMRRTV